MNLSEKFTFILKNVPTSILCERTGLSRSQINNYREGVTNPKLTQVEDILRLLGDGVFTKDPFSGVSAIAISQKSMSLIYDTEGVEDFYEKVPDISGHEDLATFLFTQNIPLVRKMEGYFYFPYLMRSLGKHKIDLVKVICHLDPIHFPVLGYILDCYLKVSGDKNPEYNLFYKQLIDSVKIQNFNSFTLHEDYLKEQLIITKRLAQEQESDQKRQENYVKIEKLYNYFFKQERFNSISKFWKLIGAPSPVASYEDLCQELWLD